MSRCLRSSQRFAARATPDAHIATQAERGAITAELATALPAIVLIGAALLDLFAAMALYLQTSQVAARAAEAITRHEAQASIEQMVSSALPASRLVIEPQGDYLIVRIGTPAPWPKSIRINVSAIAHN